MESKNLKEQLISTAKSCIGVPYLYGGENLDGFDCSGFTQYVHDRNNIQIPRTTYEQIKIGVSVDKDILQLGDLIFFGTFNNPCHVAMYIEDNQIIEAPHTGANVRISTLNNRNDFVCARRIINDDGKIMIEPQKEEKHYLGEPKYTLYQYVSNMNSDNISFRCGKYSYDKISKMNGFDGDYSFGTLNLNGESIKVFRMDKFPKKQLIISKQSEINENNWDMKIYDDDIVLEFA